MKLFMINSVLGFQDTIASNRAAVWTMMSTNPSGEGRTPLDAQEGRLAIPSLMSLNIVIESREKPPTIPSLLDIVVEAPNDSYLEECDSKALVIHGLRDKIIRFIERAQVLVLQGGTGCGKTTQVPQFILDDAIVHQRYCNIMVTQPRRIAAISVASRVAAERKSEIGELIGYRVGMEKKVSRNTRLTYLTTGTLLQRIIEKKSIKEFSHIIIDEVHERDLETDFLLLTIKKILMESHKNRSKIILMSATLTFEKFNDYFSTWNGAKTEWLSVGLPTQFHIDELYLEDVANLEGYKCLNNDLNDPRVQPEAYEMVVKIIKEFDAIENAEFRERWGGDMDHTEILRGAVLVFLPGVHEIETLEHMLMEMDYGRAGFSVPDGMSKLKVIPLHSSLPNEDQNKVFDPVYKDERKIILATNIAESSITVEDVKYIIDLCLSKSLWCDIETNYTTLRLEWASKNECIQRRGRCGRVSAGKVYRMVQKSFYNALNQERVPEMIKNSIESVILRVKMLELGDPENVLSCAVDPPGLFLMESAILNLKEIGALTTYMNGCYSNLDGKITYLGRMLASLPIDIRLAKLILLGHAFNCLQETIIIAAGLTVKTLFASPSDKRLEAYESKIYWSAGSYSDCIAILQLYLVWVGRHQNRDFLCLGEEMTWAKTHFVSLSALREMKAIIEDIYVRLSKWDISVLPSSKALIEQDLVVKVVIAGAFYPNIFYKGKPDLEEYNKEIRKHVVDKDIFSSLYFKGLSGQPRDLIKTIIASHYELQHLIPELEFHGSEAVVTFDPAANKTGRITTEVFKQIKLRQLGDKISKCKSANTRMEENRIPCPRQVLMPKLNDRTVTAMVTHINTPSEFYAVKTSDLANFRKIENLLNKIHQKVEAISIEECLARQFCIVKVKGRLFRARIDSEKWNCEEFLVFLIDRGMTVWIPKFDVYSAKGLACEEGLMLLPALVMFHLLWMIILISCYEGLVIKFGFAEYFLLMQAIKCRLSGLIPLVQNNGIWTSNAINCFEDYCARAKNLVCFDIYSIVDCVFAGVVKNPDLATTCSANEVLMRNKLADECREPLLSRKNHGIREELFTQISTSELLEHAKLFEIKQNKTFSPVSLIGSCAFEVDPDEFKEIKGPFSPLEIVFKPLCRSLLPKKVFPDRESVNSVTLDQNPDLPLSQVMVAANVSIGSRTGNVLARQTTLMPPIPGLCGLLSMLFCKKLEFRVDSDYQQYTGCITGLGFKNSKSLYPQHDVEVPFDAVLDSEDISVINTIRHCMSMVLSDPDQHNATAVKNCRMDNHANIVRLLQRNRQSSSGLHIVKSHEWGIINSSRLLEESVPEEMEELFPPHILVKLDAKPDAK
ncbi:unnamed protein product [Orchesella dallaii]|uniref:Probable ATP-dependent RNA helicase spindle-E n=1 Tax=Orchesella dallaii TaxID=48710 RepID=A0ABP1RYP2_9HEXA